LSVTLLLVYVKTHVFPTIGVEDVLLSKLLVVVTIVCNLDFALTAVTLQQMLLLVLEMVLFLHLLDQTELLTNLTVVLLVSVSHHSDVLEIRPVLELVEETIVNLTDLVFLALLHTPQLHVVLTSMVVKLSPNLIVTKALVSVLVPVVTTLVVLVPKVTTV